MSARWPTLFWAACVFALTAAVELQDVMRATSLKDIVEVIEANFAATVEHAPADRVVLLQLFTPTCA
jgi:thioredoxin-like negative regulator of GroEL